ncbi:MAG TPA: signal peptidase II [Candidatus Eremiobacteraeota bacterium]|nr:MAG: Lipoprotein signal peptidase [bacterium ADurb.Bin363]HPZ08010.1 signal peptidase II [Candidatus Eremiobacteraeota bacterium]
MKFYLVAILSIILDQITKFLILKKFSNLPAGYSEKIGGDFFTLTLVKNKGTAFGLQLITSPWPVLVSTIFVFTLLTYYVIRKYKEPFFMYGLSFILGGAVGNLIDRFRFGYVIDFLNFQIWPVFNIADIVITTGVGMIILNIFFNSNPVVNKNIKTSENKTDIAVSNLE